MKTACSGRWRKPQLLLTLFLFLLLQRPTSAEKKSYIVYLGGHAHTREEAHLIDHKGITDSHHEFLGSLLGSKDKAKDAISYSFTTFINGFSANLDDEEVKKLKGHPGVISVFPNKPSKLFTTHSWEFLGLEKKGNIPEHSAWKKANFGDDVIIGVLDTGVWPESKSYNDEGMGPVPSRWKGSCDTKDSVKCNRKLIGARFFNEGYLEAAEAIKNWDELPTTKEKALHTFTSARDYLGHGTHTSSTAGGAFVPGANIYGHANGTAKGGSPRARLATYKVCGAPLDEVIGGCYGSDILKAFAAAIHDGVDVINLSMGEEDITNYDYVNDPHAIGSFHAMMHGILVVASSGNSGPEYQTIANVAPWLLSVGASSMDREFPSYAVLGNNVSLKGQSISTAKLTRGNPYPLISGEDAAMKNVPSEKAKQCYPGSLDEEKVKGKIVLCQQSDRFRPLDMSMAASDAGAAGMVYINGDKNERLGPELAFLPSTHLSYDDGLKVLAYLNSTESPTACITHPETVINPKHKPVVGDITSRGPSRRSPEILKPDITAPGYYILAAFSPEARPTGRPYDTRRVPYVMISGTSMSSPHVSGVAGLIKSLHPDWSPSALRSAIMTTATTIQLSSTYPGLLGTAALPEDQLARATPFDAGSGQVNPNSAIDPGLVYDAAPEDYFHVLCAFGYNAKQIANFTETTTYTCPKNPPRLIDFNYPSFAVPDLSGSATVTRRLKNVGMPGTYRARVHAPRGVSMTVKPSELKFEKVGEEKTFTVRFEAKGNAVFGKYVFGKLIWSDGKHSVRSPVAVKAVDNKLKKSEL